MSLQKYFAERKDRNFWGCHGKFVFLPMHKTEHTVPPLTSASQTGTSNGKEVERLEREILRTLDEAEKLTLELLEIAPGSYNQIEEKVKRLMEILR